jgi:hypothetical protein
VSGRGTHFVAPRKNVHPMKSGWPFFGSSELADEIRELIPALVRVEQAMGLRQGEEVTGSSCNSRGGGRTWNLARCRVPIQPPRTERRMLYVSHR